MGRNGGVREKLLSAALHFALTASSETIQYRALPSHVIEKRLAAFGKTNAARQKILRDLFTEAAAPANTSPINPSRKQEYPT